MRIVHGHGGQVYVDGANLNALLGFAKPGEFGGDVSHLNLHKTSTWARRRPGVGRSRCARTWRRTSLARDAPRGGQATGIGPISAAPYGSAGILPISWAYIRLMGAEGLTRATAVAVLSANYIAAGSARPTRCSTAATAAWWPTSASSTCGSSPRTPA